MITEKALTEFKKIWVEETGEEIEDEKALAEATRLLVFMNTIYRPLRREWVEEETNQDEYDNGDTTAKE